MHHSSSPLKYKKEGFTLLELLIVIGILAILGAVVIFVLNPAEILRETRDSQRVSDLSSVKTAIGVYLTSTTSPSLGGAGVSDNAACKATPTSAFDYGTNGDRIFYSLGLAASITDTTLDAGTGIATQTLIANAGGVGGGGWIPVHLLSLSSGSPLDKWPIDPTNSITTLSTVANTDGVYRYACAASPISFEVNARLEAAKNTATMTNDGGNNTALYEVGTDLRILDCSTTQC